MVEQSRRHGHYDPRYGLAHRKSHLRLVPDPDAVGDEGVGAWEDEGGLLHGAPRHGAAGRARLGGVLQGVLPRPPPSRLRGGEGLRGLPRDRHAARDDEASRPSR